MIEFNGVSKIYDNGARGLCNLDLFIEEGEFVFVVGSSGSGKSSLVRLLLKEIEPSSGSIVVNGQDISKIKRRKLPRYRREMGVVFQDFRLLKDKTVQENVAFAMQIVEAPTKNIRREVPVMLTEVGLKHKAKAYPNQLSGGEQQRTAIARALINRPKLLIADEPTGNLDPNTAWDIMDLLDKLNYQWGTTVIVATHASDIVNDMRRRVVLLDKGELRSDKTESGYMSNWDEER